MKNKYGYFLKQLLTFVCIILTSALSYAQTPAPFSKIIFFGDSLTDNGNLYYYLLGFLPKSPPYYQGRFGNGLVWSELVDQYYLNKYSVQAVNYSVGGQTAILHSPFDGYLPYTITMSLDFYLLRSIFQDRSNTLFIIWIGANDYLPNTNNLDVLSTSVVDTVKATIDSLIYHGGRNFLVLNLPDLSKTPYAKNVPHEAGLRAASIVHNLKLDEAVASLQKSNPEIKIELFSTNKLLNDFIDNTDFYNKKFNTHINNTSDPCWKGGYTIANRKISEEDIARKIEQQQQSKTYANNDGGNMDSSVIAHFVASNPTLLEAYKVSESGEFGLKRCVDPDEYLFWDAVHPSAVVHMMMSKMIIEFIDQNYTPASPAG